MDGRLRRDGPGVVAMMDEAMRLAEASLTKGGAEFNECDLNTLARALLALRPLVDAAGKQADAWAAQEAADAAEVVLNDDAFLAWQAACSVTEAAVRALRGAR